MRTFVSNLSSIPAFTAAFRFSGLLNMITYERTGYVALGFSASVCRAVVTSPLITILINLFMIFLSVSDTATVKEGDTRA